jgi:16S rRNA (uracil1498-N3)-methyltransferase
MIQHRFFVAQPLQINTELVLEQAVSRHIQSALRMNTGDLITLFNGRGGEYSASIIDIAKKSVTVAVIAYHDINRSSELKVHLAVVMIRGDRMDYTIQKATELGVTELTPLFSERCEVKLDAHRASKKRNHWQAISTSACEQCGLNIIPEIHPPRSLAEHLSDDKSELRLIFNPLGSAWPAISSAPESVSIVTGPEGGFSPTEISEAESRGCISVKLGSRVLRAETAPVVGLGLLQSLWGDL